MDRLQEVLAEGIAQGFPGFVLLVDRAGLPAWTGARGHASLEEGTPLRPDHAFHLASVTKLFTAVATLRLVDQGRLGMSQRLVELLPASPVTALPHAREITLAQLLDHSSGLYATNNDPVYISALLGPRAGASARWTPWDFIDLASHRKPPGRPGEGTFYSDLNYVLLELVLERVTGEELPVHVRRTLFEPLGMETAYYLSELPPGAVPPVPTVQGYLKLSDVVRSITEISPSFPAAGGDLLNTTAAGERIEGAAAIVASAPDLHRFADAVFRGDLLSEESRGRLLAPARGLEGRPVGSERQGMVSAYHQPYGILVTSEGDGPGGSNTLVAHHPASDTIVVALTNIFGLWGESDFFLERAVPAALP